MTDEELNRMFEVGEEFWKEFSVLCERYIAMAPSHLRSKYIMYLGEQTSIYGRKQQ